MKSHTAILCSTMLLLASALLYLSVRPVEAQTGNIIFLGATTGTTLAANCPAAPTTPSECVVGDGVWIWESSTTGWFKPTASLTGGVTQITVNGGTAQTGAVALTIPTKVTITSTGTIQ